ncbi:hypothetical protein ACS3SW_04425 [Roseobacteraceae bacterium S113]
MNANKMCGVVLWASDDEGRAVIWCEDHGNLAFYNRHCADIHLGPALDPGDLIEFDLDDHAEHRLAHNPRLLVEDHSPSIAHGLKDAQEHQPVTERADTNVVAFPRNRRQAERGKPQAVLA